MGMWLALFPEIGYDNNQNYEYDTRYDIALNELKCSLGSF